MPSTSLARRSGKRVSMLVSLCIFAGHGLFFVAQWGGHGKDCIRGEKGPQNAHCQGGQLHPGLLKGEVSVHFDYEAERALALLRSLAEDKLCKGRLEPCPKGQAHENMQH